MLLWCILVLWKCDSLSILPFSLIVGLQKVDFLWLFRSELRNMDKCGPNIDGKWNLRHLSGSNDSIGALGVWLAWNFDVACQFLAENKRVVVYGRCEGIKSWWQYTQNGDLQTTNMFKGYNYVYCGFQAARSTAMIDSTWQPARNHCWDAVGLQLKMKMENQHQLICVFSDKGGCQS